MVCILPTLQKKKKSATHVSLGFVFKRVIKKLLYLKLFLGDSDKPWKWSSDFYHRKMRVSTIRSRQKLLSRFMFWKENSYFHPLVFVFFPSQLFPNVFFRWWSLIFSSFSILLFLRKIPFFRLTQLETNMKLLRAPRYPQQQNAMWNKRKTVSSWVRSSVSG